MFPSHDQGRLLNINTDCLVVLNKPILCYFTMLLSLLCYSYYTKYTKHLIMVLRKNIKPLLKWAKTVSEVNFDTETEGFFDHKNRIKTLQFGNSKRQFVVDFQQLSDKQKKQIERRILWNKRILKVGQNLKFDIKFLWLEGLRIRNTYDTMLAELLLHAGRTVPRSYYSLDSLVDRYLGIEIDKDMQSKIHENEYMWTKEGIQYMQHDRDWETKL